MAFKTIENNGNQYRKHINSNGKCKYCGTEPNNATTKKGLYVCCCYMLHLENGKYTQHHRDKEVDHTIKKGSER